MSGTTTHGPWRWELNEKSRRITLCGGRRPFDLLVMDFVRWGTGGAKPRFRTGGDELNLMRPAEQFGRVAVGREHHAEWFKLLDHPDANLIAQAPAMQLALELVSRGLARIERSPFGFTEFCFGGMRYSINDKDWNRVIGTVGWDRAYQALEQANSQ